MGRRLASPITRLWKRPTGVTVSPSRLQVCTACFIPAKSHPKYVPPLSVSTSIEHISPATLTISSGTYSPAPHFQPGKGITPSLSRDLLHIVDTTVSATKQRHRIQRNSRRRSLSRRRRSSYHKDSLSRRWSNKKQHGLRRQAEARQPRRGNQLSPWTSPTCRR
jgi:hypothetical protein